MKLKKNNNRGFTLVEIVTVVAILGILSSLAIGKYSNTQKTARKNADYVAATSIATAASIALSDKSSSIDGDITIDNLVTWGYLTNKPKPQSVVSGEFLLKANKDIVSVFIGNEQFYPKQ